MKRTSPILLLLAAAFFLAACTYHKVETKHEVEIKPMHITIDVNVRIQEELKAKFEKTDKTAREISDAEAEEALKKYLESSGKE